MINAVNNNKDSYVKPRIISWEESKRILYAKDVKICEQNKLKKDQADFAMLMRKLEQGGQISFA
jgi:hypothetical protein